MQPGPAQGAQPSSEGRRRLTTMLRGRHLFTYDLIVIAIAILGAFALRFDAANVFAALGPYLPVALLPLAIQPLVNIQFGLYRREWRYASVRDMVGIVAAVLAGTVIAATMFVLLAVLGFPGTSGMPRSFFPLEALLSLVLIGGGRFAIRWELENNGRSGGTDEERFGVRTLVYGAGEAGAAVARLAGRDPTMRVRVVGFLDDDTQKRGSKMLGTRIYGGLDRMAEAARAGRAAQLVVAMPSAPGPVVRRAVEGGRALGLDVKIVPHLHELVGGSDQISRIRPIGLDDLLRREPARHDPDELTQYLSGASVVVTGGGGSIGGELARQVLAFGPRRLTVLDNSEVALWTIKRALEDQVGPNAPAIVANFVDVRSATAVRRAIEASQADVVFHAAALKHVPICESHPSEAFLTNVIGTRNIVGACADVGQLVLISTDKAVSPVSIMGATKRLAELITVDAATGGARMCIVVRFGNVLGSSGSVVPIFQRQLEQGLPLTITHPDATRYFMTIPEAVGLILVAGSDAAPGEVYMLDMGQPVRIVDLAEDMIRLAGLAPSDVAIVYTGLRPGERLHETLLFDHETIQPTHHDRVFQARSMAGPALPRPVHEIVAELEQAALAGDDQLVREGLTRSGLLEPARDVATSIAT